MIRLTLIMAFLVASLWPSIAMGQKTYPISIECEDVAEAEQILRGKYQEEMVGFGRVSENIIAELWLPSDGNTWSFIFRMKSKILCLVSSGHYWRTPLETIPTQGKSPLGG